MTPRKHRPAAATELPSGESGSSLISNQNLVALYATMLKCRMLERCIRGQALGRVPRLRGREAVASGVAIHMLPEDRVQAVDGGRLPEFVQQLIKQGSMAEGAIRAVLAQPGDRDGQARNRAPWDEALKLARALKHAKTRNAVALFCERMEAPVEALRSAAQEKLPILFVCHNRREKENLAAMAEGCRLPGMVVDCDDAVAIYRVASEAFTHARRGNGPTLLECRHWPASHNGKNPSRAGSDAVRIMERYLAGKGLWSRELKKDTVAQFARELDSAFARISNSAR